MDCEGFDLKSRMLGIVECLERERRCLRGWVVQPYIPQ